MHVLSIKTGIHKSTFFTTFDDGVVMYVMWAERRKGSMKVGRKGRNLDTSMDGWEMGVESVE